MGGQSQAASTNQTTTSTVNVVDSYKSSINRVDNLSDVGNVTLSIGDEGGGTSGLIQSLPMLAFFAVAGIVVFSVFKRK